MSERNVYRTEAEICNVYGLMGEHPRWTVWQWQMAVLEGLTRAGYWTWVIDMLDGFE